MASSSLCVLAAILASFLPLLRGELAFQGPRTFDVNQHPNAAVVADFNLDGKPDLAVATDFGLSILLGNGDATFQPAISYLDIEFLTFAATGDFNRDGKPDLVLSDGSKNGVIILLGNGDGTFGDAIRVASGLRPECVAVADLNGDGLLDILVANAGEAAVSIHLGNGDGTFQAATKIPTGGNLLDPLRVPGPQFVVAGDFNGDGKPDLAVAKFVNDFHDVEGLLIFLGNGDGTFQDASRYSLPFGALAIAVADFDADGKADLAVANYYSSRVTVYMGRGDGSFRNAGTYGPLSPSHVAVADVDGDGRLDLIAADALGLANDLNSGGAAVLLGNGDGTFQTAVEYYTGAFPVFIATCDCGGNPTPELVVVNSLSYDVAVLARKMDGNFPAARTAQTGGRPMRLVRTDFNRDGHLDLAVLTEEGLCILLGKGDGSFQPSVQYPAGKGSVLGGAGLAATDFNRDGNADLVVVRSESNEMFVLMGFGDGTFESAHRYPFTGGPVSVVATDFDGDGIPDLAVGVELQERDIYFLKGNGDGTFQAGTKVDAGVAASFLAVGDFNGDRVPDLVSGGFDRFGILLGNGDGTFGPALVQNILLPGSVAIGDWNGDGVADLAAGTYSGVAIFAGKGDGTLASPVFVMEGAKTQAIAAADFAGDGHASLAVAEFWGQVSLLAGDGQGLFAVPVKYGTGTSPASIVAGDFDEDGRPDVAIANFNSSNVTVLLNRTTRP